MKYRLPGILIVVWAFLAWSAGHAATVTWTGGGTDEKFSTAANWSSNAVPSETDDVVFDGTSAKNCTIDQNVTVGSFKIDAAYTGTVSGGTAVITIAAGSFDELAGGFEPGTSTIKFTGSSDQLFKTQNIATEEYYNTAPYYNVENAKTDGKLTFSYRWQCVRLNKLKVSAGTTTELPAAYVWITDLDLQGADGDLAVVRSESATLKTNLIFSGGQSIQYVDFKNISSVMWGSKAIDGGTGCVDSGGNENINFNGVKVWTGLGADNNWSTAANWSGSVVPTNTQDVLFDGTSAKSCTVDANVSTYSLTICSDYAGTVSGGSATISVASKDFDVTHGGFDAGSSTIKFTGSGEQYMRMQALEDNRVFHTIENAKSGGILKFAESWFSVEIDTLKAASGTITELPHTYLVIDNLDLQGTAGNLVTLRSRGDGARARITVTGIQTIQYVDFKDIQAYILHGKAIDATKNCTDSGNNIEVHFSATRWTGLGADNLWSTAQNWTDNTVPTASSIVVIDGAASKDCELVADVEVASLRIEDVFGYGEYTNELKLGSYTLTINSGQLKAGDTANRINSGTGCIKFTGTEEQDFHYPMYASFNKVEVDGAFVDFSNGCTISTLKINAGSEVMFPYHTMTIATIDWQGTATEPIYLRRDASNATWKLNFTNTAQTVSYVRVSGCDASTGTTVDATANCLDLGSNSNWTFSSAAGVVIPSSSVTSPVCVEGWVQAGGSQSVTIDSGSGDNAVTFTGAKPWFYNAALSAASGTTITVKDAGTALTSGTCTWTATNVDTSSSVDIRKDDSLLLTVGTVAAGETLHLDTNYDGTTFTTDVSGNAGDDNVAALFATAGTYTVAARIDTGTIATMTVNVISVDLGSNRLGCWNGYSVPRTVGVTPSGSLGGVWFGPSNAAAITVASDATTLLGVTAQDVTTAKSLVARLGSETGPIIAYKTASCFDLEWVTAAAMPTLEKYADGDVLVAGSIKMTPHFDDVTIKLDTRSSSILFESGLSTQNVNTADLDQNGRYNYYMTMPADGRTCHAMSVIENE